MAPFAPSRAPRRRSHSLFPTPLGPLPPQALSSAYPPEGPSPRTSSRSCTRRLQPWRPGFWGPYPNRRAHRPFGLPSQQLRSIHRWCPGSRAGGRRSSSLRSAASALERRGRSTAAPCPPPRWAKAARRQRASFKRKDIDFPSTPASYCPLQRQTERVSKVHHVLEYASSWAPFAGTDAAAVTRAPVDSCGRAGGAGGSGAAA